MWGKVDVKLRDRKCVTGKVHTSVTAYSSVWGYMRDTMMSRCEQAHAGQSRVAVSVSGSGSIVEWRML